MIWEHVASNKRSSYLLFFFFFLFCIGMGFLFGFITGWGYFGAILALIIAILMAFFTYYYSDTVVLKISRARPATHEENTYLDNTVDGLAIAAGIPKPKIYVIDDTAPNAFATGRDPQHAVICVTTGLMQKMNRAELEGVIAHEMSHIGNYDIRFMMLVTVMVGLIALLSDWMMRSFWWGGGKRDNDSKFGLILLVIAIVMAILAPLIAMLMQLALSRKREYLADASAAILTRYPEGLASALEKLEKDTEPLEAANKATAHLYIVNPLNEHKSFLNNLFNTHPPIAERVKRLRAM
ncbi:MAG: zinc metalloprotease HtpX [Candidatus Diapherotrites archaeon]|nr:zinc metalloprotease HtpX [Candidatus Diapherotrites archaeon]